MAPKTRPKRRTATFLVDPEHDQKLMSEDEEEDEDDSDYVPDSGSDEEEEDSEEEEEEEGEEEGEEEEEEDDDDKQKEEEVKIKTTVLDLDGKGTTISAYGLFLRTKDIVQTTDGLLCIFSKLGEKPNMADVHWLFPTPNFPNYYTKGIETTSLPLVLVQSKLAGVIHVNRLASSMKDLSYESGLKVIQDGICSVETVSFDIENIANHTPWTLDQQKELEFFFRSTWLKLKNMHKPHDESFYGKIFCKWANNHNADAKSWILYKFNRWENAVLQILRLDWQSEVNEVVSL